MIDPTSFSRLRVSSWRQFADIDLDLSSRLTVLTGENGTGKTTLLSALGAHFDWYSSLVGTPYRNAAGRLSYRAGTGRTTKYQDPQFEANYVYSKIGSLSYANGERTEVRVPESDLTEFSVEFSDRQNVPGIFLDSHRSVSGYQAVQMVPAHFSTATEIMANFINELNNRRRGWNTSQSKTPMLLMKEALIASAIYGEGNSSVASDPEAAAVWGGFQAVLMSLFPRSVGFQRLRVEAPEIVIQTANGDFAIEAISGGLSAIFELAWQIFLRSRETDVFTVCFDEPENHLHPSLQKALLPSLLEAFPRVQFVVATHSPFVVTSSEDARVYVLARSEGGVEAEELELRNQPVSAERTLRDVLGVGSTQPLWVERRFDAVLSRFSNHPPSPEMIRQLRAAMDEAGIAATFADALSLMPDSSDDRPEDGDRLQEPSA